MAAVVFMVPVVLAGVALLALANLLWGRRRVYLLASRLQGPPAWPLLGNGDRFMCAPKGEGWFWSGRSLMLGCPFLFGSIGE